MDCPSDEKMFALFAGDLLKAEADEILNHIEKCPACFKNAAETEAVEMFLRSIESTDGGKTFQMKPIPELDEGAVGRICKNLGILPPTPENHKKLNMFMEGYKHFEEGEYNEAIKIYDRILEIDPVFKDAITGKEKALAKLQELEEKPDNSKNDVDNK